MMRTESALNIAARPGTARVIFIRSSVDVSGTLVPIVSASGALLGELPSSSCFAADLEPGPQRFVTLTRPVGVLDANLVGGLTYFVNVDVRFGTRSPRFRLEPVKAPNVEAAAKSLADCDALTLTQREVMDAAPFFALAGEKTAWEGDRLPALQQVDGQNFGSDR